MSELVASYRLNGLVTDVPAFAVPPDKWTGATQVNFRSGVAERRQGYAAAASTPLTPAAAGPQYGIFQAQYGAASRTATNIVWYGGVAYGGTASKIGSQVGGVDSDVTPVGWGTAAPGRWTGGILNNFVPVLNNQTDVPLYYDIIGAAWNTLPNYNPLGAGTGSWTALRPYREFLVGMGLLISASSYRSDVVYWSDAAPYNVPPTTWVAAATNQAGDAIVPGGGEIVDGATLGEAFVIYKRRSCYRMRYIGGNFVMAVDPMFGEFGAWSQNCVAEAPGMHYVFTGEDVVAHDGQSWQSLIRGKTRKLIKDNLSTTNSESWGSFVFFDPNERELWVNLVAASGTYAAKALVVNVDTGEAGLYSHAEVLSHMFLGPQGKNVYGVYYGTGSASTGRFYTQESGNTAAGTNITATLTREALDFGKPEQRKTIRWVRPHLKPTGSAVTLGVEVGYSDTPQGTPTYIASQNFVTGTTDKVNVLAASGRFISFRFTSADSVAHWQMSGFDVGYTLGGMT